MKNYKMMEWTDEKVKKFWDFESNFPENYFSYQVGKEVVDRLYKYFNFAGNALDYGAGLGFIIPHLMNKGIAVSALDFSLDSIEAINEKFNGNKYFDGAFTIDDLLNENKKFDLITVIEVVEHLNDNYLNKVMININNLLSSKGVAVITTPNDEELSKLMVFCPESEVVFHRWQHVRRWSEETIYMYLKKSGFEIIDILTTNFSIPVKKKTILSEAKMAIKMILRKPIIQEKQPHLIAIIKKGEHS